MNQTLSLVGHRMTDDWCFQDVHCLAERLMCKTIGIQSCYSDDRCMGTQRGKEHLIVDGGWSERASWKR